MSAFCVSDILLTLKIVQLKNQIPEDAESLRVLSAEKEKPVSQLIKLEKMGQNLTKKEGKIKQKIVLS